MVKYFSECSSPCVLYPLPGLSDMDSPLSEDYVVLAPGRPEPLVSLHWKEPESNGLDVCRWDTNRASVVFWLIHTRHQTAGGKFSLPRLPSPAFSATPRKIFPPAAHTQSLVPTVWYLRKTNITKQTRSIVVSETRIRRQLRHREKNRAWRGVEENPRKMRRWSGRRGPVPSDRCCGRSAQDHFSRRAEEGGHPRAETRLQVGTRVNCPPPSALKGLHRVRPSGTLGFVAQ